MISFICILQTSLKKAQNNSISDKNSKNYMDKSIEAIRNGIWASEKVVDDDEQHRNETSNGDCTRPTFSGENGCVDGIDKRGAFLKFSQMFNFAGFFYFILPSINYF